MPSDTDTAPVKSPLWQKLSRHAEKLSAKKITALFDDDAERFQKFSRCACGLLLDFSKNRIDDRAFELLLALAQEQDLEPRRDQLFNGEIVNLSEGRAANHMALRSGKDPAVENVLSAMENFTEAVHSGTRTGFSGKPFTDAVVIGIGGSLLGPEMATTALAPYASGKLNMHFVGNIDAADLSGTLENLNPETTLFLMASKTFTTRETMVNGETGKGWLLNKASENDWPRHFVAMTANADAALNFGVPFENIFPFKDWVGGRFSLWSSIGLPVALVVGMDNFRKLLDGTRAMDDHFLKTPLADNLAVILALVGVWNINFQNLPCHGIFPYEQSLKNLPRYLQQLEMESNGKGVTNDGAVFDGTAAIVFGEPGTGCQHSFFQLLHQGRLIVAADFIASATSFYRPAHHHDQLLANFLAQPEALMTGQPSESSAPASAKNHFPGNRPSNSILMERLTPQTLGALIALYEHKVFVQSVIWNINPFDQWGVELGKRLADTVLPELTGGSADQTFSPSTTGLIDAIKKIRDRPA